VSAAEGSLERKFNRPDGRQTGLRLAEPAAGKAITVSYLAKGMTWAP